MTKQRSFLGRVVDGIKAVSSYTRVLSLTDRTGWANAFGDGTHSGKQVSEASAMGLATAWCCIRVITEAIGSLPWGIYQRDGKGNAVEVKTHPLYPVLMQSPNMDQTSGEFRESIVSALCTAGNSYCLKDTLGGEVISLMPVKGVIPFRKRGSNSALAVPDGSVVYRVPTFGGQMQDYTRDGIWHVKGFGNDPLMGLSPIGVVREAVGFAIAAEEFGSRFFQQGGRPGGTVSIDGWLTKEQREVARENLNQLMVGLENAHKFVLFEGKMKPEPWGEMSLADMAFVQVRNLSVQEMCRIWRVPLHMVAEMQKGASFASIEQTASDFVMFTLLPYLTRIEQSVSRWLLSPADRQKCFVRFRYDGLMRADTAGRTTFYASAVNNGWMSRNEVRALENLNSVPGLDEYTAQTALAPVDQLGALAAAAAAQPAAPEPQKAGETHVHTHMAAPQVTLSTGAVNVTPKTEVHPAAVSFAPHIDVQPADVKVEPAQVFVDAPVTIEAPQFKFDMPPIQIKLEANEGGDFVEQIERDSKGEISRITRTRRTK